MQDSIGVIVWKRTKKPPLRVGSAVDKSWSRHEENSQRMLQDSNGIEFYWTTKVTLVERICPEAEVAFTVMEYAPAGVPLDGENAWAIL